MNGELNGIMEEPMDTSSPMEKKAMLYTNHCKSTKTHNHDSPMIPGSSKLDFLNNCIMRKNISPNTSQTNHNNGNNHEINDDEQYSNDSCNDNSNNIGLHPQMQNDEELSQDSVLIEEEHSSDLDEIKIVTGTGVKNTLVITEIREASDDSKDDIFEVCKTDSNHSDQMEEDCVMEIDDDSKDSKDNSPDVEIISKSDTQDTSIEEISQDVISLNEDEVSEIKNDIIEIISKSDDTQDTSIEEIPQDVISLNEDEVSEIKNDIIEIISKSDDTQDTSIEEIPQDVISLNEDEVSEIKNDIEIISKSDDTQDTSIEEIPQDVISLNEDEVSEIKNDIEIISKSDDTQDTSIEEIPQDVISLNEDEVSEIKNDISDDVEIIKDDHETGIRYHRTNNEISHEEDSEEASSNEDSVEQVEETVSIDSHDDDSTDSKAKNNHVILDNGDNNVHEIISDNDDNDDCIIQPESRTPAMSTQAIDLRRSSRKIKRKRFDDEDEDESDVEMVTLKDPLNQYNKMKPFTVNDTKTVVEMASKQIKSHQTSNDKKEPTVVIIDTKSILSGKIPFQGKNSALPSSTNPQKSAQELYQSIAARGTTVTPVPTKNLTNTSTQSASQPYILPSLTDDMFVVEAPSFIVPYVYEKPSIKPFREFVDILGKKLDELRSKEEIEKPHKERDSFKADAEGKSNKDENMETKTEAEKNSKSPVEETEEVETPKKKKNRRDRKPDDDDASWDGESEDSDDDVISDDDEKTVVIKEKDDSLDNIKDTISDLSTEKVPGYKPDNYFECSLGTFFINIGLNLVQEHVQNDLLKQQKRKLYREKKSGANTKGTESAITSLMKNLQFSKENNAPYYFPQHKCEFCTFKSESMLAMSHHLETPHMKNNVYKCNFCSYEIRSPHDILFHMEVEHNTRGRLERAPAYHQCANCPFEDNGKGKLARHLIPCAKKFKPELNLVPPTEWEPPAKIPKISRARSNMMSSYQTTFNKNALGTNNLTRTPLPTNSMMQGGVNNFRPKNRPTMPVTPRAMSSHGSPMMRGGVMNNQTNKNSSAAPKLLQHQPSISITPLPRHPQPVPGQPIQHPKGTFVICEICDGYIKDLEQLRNHMQWIHKVKIHPKMIYNRPPLNCQKCQFRFFTDQGLERHLLGSHGLVTSSMQESANKGKDAGRCPICGRVYQWKLLNHVARDHNVTLKPAHLSYKCTVCTATFGMYKQFENHVYSAHSVVAKRVVDKTKTSSPKPSESLLKPLKINDEITIIPQPAKPSGDNPKVQECVDYQTQKVLINEYGLSNAYTALNIPDVGTFLLTSTDIHPDTMAEVVDTLRDVDVYNEYSV